MVKRPDTNETVRPMRNSPGSRRPASRPRRPTRSVVDRAEPVRHIRIIPPGRIEAQPAFGAVGQQDHLGLEVVALERHREHVGRVDEVEDHPGRAQCQEQVEQQSAEQVHASGRGVRIRPIGTAGRAGAWRPGNRPSGPRVPGYRSGRRLQEVRGRTRRGRSCRTGAGRGWRRGRRSVRGWGLLGSSAAPPRRSAGS